MSLFSTAAKLGARVPIISDLINRHLIVERYANATSPRPRPFSMSGAYSSWPGLTDRRWTGRHLPEADEDYVKALPPEEDVLDLFKRKEFIPSTDTSMMFMFFAQWFTDSFLRTDFKDPRLNSSNHEIDLCQIYGLREDRAGLLREHEGGRLAHQMTPQGAFPEYLFDDPEKLVVREKFKNLHPQGVLEHVFAPVPVEAREKVFAVGLEHGNATVGYSILNTLFLREHNRIAGLLEDAYGFDDERLYQTTRMILTVILLKIVVEDYIRHIAPIDFPIKTVVGAADKAKWGKTNWIAIEFNLLYRWHPMVPDTMMLGGHAMDATGFLNNNAFVLEHGLGPLISDLSAQHCGRMGLRNTPLFMFQPGKDGALSTVGRTISISRAARLQSFNAYRRQFKMNGIFDFEDLAGDAEMADRLKDLYGRPENVEWFVGLFAEQFGPAEMMGKLMTTMVAHDAFTQALTNPLLSKRVHTEATFTPLGLEIIDETSTLAQLVERNLGPEVTCSFEVVR